jgi:hypothetical protein
MKLVLALLLCVPAFAHAWGVAGMQYMYQPPQTQQQPPQPSYSEQYNAGYMDAYQNAHGYQSSTGQGNAYSEGYRAAWKAEHRQ